MAMLNETAPIDELLRFLGSSGTRVPATVANDVAEIFKRHKVFNFFEVSSLSNETLIMLSLSNETLVSELSQVLKTNKLDDKLQELLNLRRAPTEKTDSSYPEKTTTSDPAMLSSPPRRW